MKMKICAFIIICVLFYSYSYAQGSKELKFGLGADDIHSVYPWESTDKITDAVIINIYEGLTSLSPKGSNVEPCLAERWEASKDFTEWTFYLRKNVKFHNGETFTADHVIESFKIGGFQFGKVSKIDDYKIRIVLSEAKPALPITLANLDYFISAKATIEGFNKDKIPTQVFGTGPFKFKSWERGKRIVLDKNDAYWGEKAKLDRVIFIPFSENEALLKALLTGAIDITDGIVSQNIAAIRQSKSLLFKSEVSLNYAYMVMNNKRKPFDNVKVRQAIAYAINKKELINKYFLGGQAGMSAKSCMPPAMFGFYKDLPDYEFNPAKAKQLLKEAGYPAGFQASLTPAGAVRPYMPDPLGIANSIKAQLKQVGIDLTIKPAKSWSDFLSITLIKMDYDIALLGWIADTADPYDFLHDPLSGESIGKYNASGWSNKEFDSLLNLANSEPLRSVQYYHRAQLIFHDEVPQIPLFHAYQIAAWREGVSGFILHPLGYVILKKVWVK
ncbi:MAG: hypothetical protein A2Y62_04350 [Candidatus Fischerbacteria bacterium RBG_13_37_8]|uniref:Solute-binding protein family 5 domain-containing protein n=1 Tax=Candidatus Fischerbacteria bacterium RBG_13_37_8 TaxID=1817863 RepID=A0A1F5VG45_9BACT|nr:MAG: hypothetical protein A2Y62_04350 [Candidatus Fischerbacteria bacterium RBG_13_37_8]